ncbi:hypothetical protein LZT24_05110 [Aeromonas veronii]|uniref:hypothetical protein n=1 Tax=Aeromonas veronii TaxID=654 RepID=UPI0021E78D3C|nr:hypothetical protein [Aeromonas veronii]MCV3283465.1 hypothetical protein [Aeromonas veronii]
MHRIDTSTAQKDKFGAGKHGFSSGNAQTGVPATEVSPDILDAFQEEIASVIEDAGIALDKSKNNQLLKAIKSFFKNASDTISGVVRFATKEEALSGSDSFISMNPLRVMDTIKSFLVGIPLPWPMSSPPSWGMAYQGQAFSSVENPILAQRYPSLVLPDLRAEFLRGLDAGRGKDAGRTILSVQAASLIVGELADRAVSLSRMQNVKQYYFDQLTDTVTQIAMSSVAGTANNVQPLSSQYVGGARPTSVAFLWITIRG